ncbi:MAG: HAD family phosphatase [Lachnospiraceae bacterium]|nr:HAD family phosphatase [Lachnospiraceae bacterium]
MNRKYIFTDLDGTLLDDNKEVCAENKSAIEEALSKGHQIIVATGRPLPAAVIGAKHAGLYRKGCYILCYNGGMIFDCTEEKVIYEASLDMDNIRALYKSAKEAGIHVQAYDKGKVICEEEDDEIKFYARHGQMEYELRDNFPETLSKPSLKMLLISFDNKKLVKFKEAHPELENDKMHSFFSCLEYLEYMPAGISKGDGIIKMAELLHFDIKDTIAIGDERNDLTMIEKAGLGVAMQNAAEDAKKVADYITVKNNNEGGVAEVIRKFAL